MRKGIEDVTRAERMEIGILLSKGYSHRSIANALARGKSTVSYEIKENSVNGVYDPMKADLKARLRKRMRRFQWSKIEEDPALKRVIVEKLSLHWNPDEIAGWMKREGGAYVSKTAIYEWLQTARGARYQALLYAKRQGRGRKKPRGTRTLIPNRVDIQGRFAGADNRSRYGHFEGDTVVGKKGTAGGVKVVLERKSRLLIAKKVGSMRPAEHARVERCLFSRVKALSLTRDNGIENRNHERVPVPSFFCRPYASWQKGSVEHGNKMLRRYFRKGTDFSLVSQADIDRAIFLINNKPRKILGYQSALEVALRAGIIKNTSVLTEG